MLQYRHWLEGYHDMGLVHLEPEEVGNRLRLFLRHALEDGRLRKNDGG